MLLPKNQGWQFSGTVKTTGEDNYMYDNAKKVVGPGGKLWYNWAGGMNSASNWITNEKLDEFNAFLKAGTITTAHYCGIMYDIEVIHEWVESSKFEESFKVARDQGFKVMVTTS